MPSQHSPTLRRVVGSLLALVGGLSAADVTSAITADSNGNGKIDRVTLTFDQAVTVASGSTGITVGGYAISGNFNSTSSTTLVLSLTESASVDSGATPTVTVVSANLPAGSTAMTTASKSVTASDGAAPVIRSGSTELTTQDTDNDGFIDRINGLFSESVSGGVHQDFDIAGATGEQVTVSGSSFRVDFTDGVLSSDAAPRLAYTATDGANITDSAGNKVPNAANLTPGDVARPVVTKIISNQTDKTLKVGDAVTFTVSFSEAVTLAGASSPVLRLTLSNGAQVVASNITSQTSVDFTYTVQAADTSGVLSTATLTVSVGATLRDARSNDILLASAGVLNASQAISLTTLGYSLRVDTQNNRVMAATVLDRDGNGIIDALRVQFADKIKDSTVAVDRLSVLVNSTPVTIGTVGTESAENDEFYLFSIAESQNYGTGIRPSVQVVSGNTTMTDLAGNALASGVPVVAPDTVVPRLLSLRATPTTGVIVKGQTIRLEATFSEPMAGAVEVTFLDAVNGDFTLQLVPEATTGESLVYQGTLPVGHELSQLSVLSVVNVPANSARDKAGNSWPEPTSIALIPATSLSGLAKPATTTATASVDTKVPTLVGITTASGAGAYHLGDAVGVTITFSEPLKMPAGSLIVTMDDGAITGVPFTKTFVASEVTGKKELTFDYVVRAEDKITTLGVASVKITNDTLVTDANNNVGWDARTDTNLISGTVALAGINVDGTVASTRPYLTKLEATPATGTIKVGDTLRLIATFSETVTGNLTVTLDGIGPVTLVASGGTQAVYEKVLSSVYAGERPSLLVTGVANASLVDVEGLAPALPALVSDLDPTIFTAVTTAEGNLTTAAIDTQMPTLASVTSTTPDGTYHAGDSINVTLNFSEKVTLSGGQLVVTMQEGAATGAHFTKTFQAADINGSMSVSFDYVVRAGDASLNPTSLTIASIKLVQNATTDAVVADAAGNTGYSFLKNGSADLTPPGRNLANRQLFVDTSALSVQAANTVDRDADGYADAIRMTFTNAVKDSSVSSAKFTIAGASGVEFLQEFNADPANDTVVYLAFTDGVLRGDALPTVTWEAAAAKDAAGNALLAGSRTATDGVQPVITAITGTSGVKTAGDEVDITVAFSEPLVVDTAAGTPTITLNNLTGSAVLTGTPVFTGLKADGMSLGFTYQVQRNDTTVGQWLRVSALTIPGGSSIRDILTHGAQRDAALTVPGASEAMALETLSPMTVQAQGLTLLDTVRTSDLDNDGLIDHIRLTFTQGVKDSTVSAADFTVDGLAASDISFDSTVGGVDVANDEVIYLTVAEKLHGGKHPRVSYNSANGVMSNLSGVPFASDSKIAKDGVAVRILKVQAATANGNYLAGANLDIAVTFNEPVKVPTTGTLTLPLTIGGAARVAALDASRNTDNGNGSTVLNFRYTVAAGDQGALAYANNAALNLAYNLAPAAPPADFRSLSLTYEATYTPDAALTLPLIGTSAALDRTSNIKIGIANNAPVGVPLQVPVTAGDTTRFTVAVTDPDGDTMTVTPGLSGLGLVFTAVAGTSATFDVEVPSLLTTNTEVVTFLINDGTNQASVPVTFVVNQKELGFVTVPETEDISIATMREVKTEKVLLSNTQNVTRDVATTYVTVDGNTWEYRPRLGMNNSGVTYALTCSDPGMVSGFSAATGFVQVNVLTASGVALGVPLVEDSDDLALRPRDASLQVLKGYLGRHVHFRLTATRNLGGQVIQDTQEWFLFIHEEATTTTETTGTAGGNG